MPHDPNKETPAERLARKKRERAAYKEAQERKSFVRDNTPKDDEERRDAEAEDKHLADNLNAILRGFDGMSEQEFKAALRRTSSRKIRKAGGKAKVRKEFKKRNSGCAVVGLALVSALGAACWGAVELAVAVMS